MRLMFLNVRCQMSDRRFIFQICDLTSDIKKLKYDTRTNQEYEGPCGGSEEVSLTSIIVIIK